MRTFLYFMREMAKNVRRTDAPPCEVATDGSPQKIAARQSRAAHILFSEYESGDFPCRIFPIGIGKVAKRFQAVTAKEFIHRFNSAIRGGTFTVRVTFVEFNSRAEIGESIFLSASYFGIVPNGGTVLDGILRFTANPYKTARGGLRGEKLHSTRISVGICISETALKVCA